jgi:hypothetical protein
VAVPFVYAYFGGAIVSAGGVLPLEQWPIGKVAKWIFVTTY